MGAAVALQLTRALYASALIAVAITTGLWLYQGDRIGAQLRRSAVVALQLQTGMTGISCIRTARVVGATPEGDGYLIDCILSPPFSQEELESLPPYSA